MRHGDAGDAYPDEAMDHFRPLTTLGVDQVKNQAKWLSKKGKQPDLVVTDDFTRCIQTAKIMADKLGLDLEMDTRLQDPDGLEAVLDTYKARGRKPIYVTHHDVMDRWSDDDPEDRPVPAEIRRFGHGDQELKRRQPHGADDRYVPTINDIKFGKA